MESPKNRFSLILEARLPGERSAGAERFLQHGHAIEVKGRVMVNGQEAVVNSDRRFRHFTSPLPSADNMITVTAQNAKGGVNTKQQSVTIQ